jgi:hypothetical protein
MALPYDDPPDTQMPKELPLPLRWLLKVFAGMCLILGVVGRLCLGCPPPYSS